MRMLVFISVFVAVLVILPGIVRGTVVDTGYRPDRDGFGFANFADPEGVAGVDLNALAGTDFHDEIFCHTGHCFGMAEASVANYEDGKASAGVSQAEAMPVVDRLQTSQSFYYIADFFRRPFGEKPANNSVEYRRLADRLAAGKPAVIGIYASGGSYPGHALVAYKIEQIDDTAFIYVYDPNLPPTLYDYEAEPLAAAYDVANGTFAYDNGRFFDQMRVDDVDGAGVAEGKALSAGILGLPCIALAAVLIRRPRPKSK